MMSQRRLINDMVRFCGSLIIVLLLSTYGFSAEQAKKIKGPVVITSEMLKADNKARTALFERSVVARSTDMTIYADKMLVHYEEGSGNVTQIDAEGQVKVTKENRVITSREAVYYAADEKVVFTGDPRAVEGENVVTGKKMTYLMNDDIFLVEESKVFLKKNNSETPMHTLEAKGISKYYGKRHVVKGLTFHVGTGEIVGLLGPNGAGKTTTFYMIVGLIKPDGGEIVLDDEDLTGLPMYRRSLKGISYLPQEPSIFRKLSVEDNLRAVLEIRGLRQEEIDVEVDRLLKEFALTELSTKEGYKLSGGERRKTEIARAIAIKPRFILFDEPFAGIDPIAIIELKKMFTYLKGKGLGILITDHNVRDTLSITDRAYIINNGEILEEGSPEKLIADARVKEAFLGEEFTL